MSMKRNTRRGFLKQSAVFGTGAALGAAGLLGGCRCGCLGPDSAAESGLDFSRIAFCCADCDTCPLYKATINRDDAAKMAVAEKWGGVKEPGFKLEDYYCYGCKDRRSCGRPGRDCTIRECAMKKGFAVCAQCRDFEICDGKLWKNYPQARDRVRQMKAKLGIA